MIAARGNVCFDFCIYQIQFHIQQHDARTARIGNGKRLKNDLMQLFSVKSGIL
jgi:hypothetical protein